MCFGNEVMYVGYVVVIGVDVVVFGDVIVVVVVW